MSAKTKKAFHSCSNYRKDDDTSCRAIFSDIKGKPDFTPRTARVAALLPCPKCGSVVNKCSYIDKVSKQQKTFWACSKYVKGKPAQSCDAKFDEVDGQPVLSDKIAATSSGKCPACKTGKLIRRQRRDLTGYFHGCDRWNATKNPCKAIYDDVDGKPDIHTQLLKAAPTGPNCKCGNGTMKRYARKNGDGFIWCCSDYRNSGCKNILEDDNGKPVAPKKKNWNNAA